MKIRNAGRGIHAREVSGIDKLRTLPPQWYAFANLELHLSPSETRETDVFIVMDDRILLVDLKDWHGTVRTENGRWLHNDHVISSPVEKIRYNARMLGPVLSGYIMKRAQRLGQPLAKAPFIPFTQGVIVTTGSADYSGIALNDRGSVIHIDHFLKIADPRLRREMLGDPNAFDRKNSLLESDGYWRGMLGEFFNIQTGLFRPQQRIYGSYVAVSDYANYEHRYGASDGGIYAEYDAEEKGLGRAPGLLRLWDFSHADARFQSEGGRHEIAGREHEVIQYLKDRNDEFDTAVLQVKAVDHERTAHFWEVFEKRRSLWRLRDISVARAGDITAEHRIEFAQGLLASVKALHDIDVTHLDIGGHSVWLESPSTVKLSHLFAASYPQLQSLGEDRYQFLTAAWKYPEDELGDESDKKRRDVFLLGNAVHTILFGKEPRSTSPSAPPEWDAAVDEDDSFLPFHDWLNRALSWDVTIRFSDAGAALAEFNKVASRQSSPTEFWRLDRFKRWQDQFEVQECFPVEEWLKRTVRTLVWKSYLNDRSVIVKLWKRSCWGDDRLEAPRLLQFLERAEALAQSPIPGLAKVVDYGFVGDAIVLVHEYVPGETLDIDLSERAESWRDPTAALVFLGRLARIIVDIHNARSAHGDLKPANIVISRTGESESPTPTIIDVVEFESISDGEVLTTAYSPGTGGRAERDRFAVARISQEILALADLDTSSSMMLGAAIQRCIAGPPPNATLLPLTEAMDKALSPPPPPPQSYSITVKYPTCSKLLSDDGRYGVRLAKSGNVIVRGAMQELELERSADSLVPKRIYDIDQARAARVSRDEQYSFKGELFVEAGVPEASELSFVLGELKFEQALAPSDDVAIEADDELPDDDAAADEVVEAAILEAESSASTDVPLLWRTLIDVERELPTEGVAATDSAYRAVMKRYIVPFDLERGSFEFSRLDRVLVERQRSGSTEWRELGVLDVSASRPDLLADASGRRGRGQQGGLISRAGDRLRLRSVLESLSQEKREAATTRILTRRSVRANLIDYFADNAHVSHAGREHDMDAIQKRYRLNDSQAEAFERLLGAEPLGLLQGPPGTGKTKFIASFIHYVVTAELARNVLLASQSHEALNNAAEEVTKLFRETGDEPSLVRLGQEGVVSSDLRSFHSEIVERRYKDSFRAELVERLSVVATHLGLDADLTSKLIFAETRIRPAIDRFRLVSQSAEEARRRSLQETILRLCAKVNVESGILEDLLDENLYDDIINYLSSGTGVSPDRVSRFLRVTAMSRDWLASVSTRQRSFDTFLAGTRRIVAGTCVGLGRAAFGVTQTKFDFVVVDEAARCTASELAVPMQTGRRVILVGDHLQLEPHHRPDVVKEVSLRIDVPKREILRSDFERVFQSSFGDTAGATLDEQYRMVPPIGRLVSDAFYSRTPLVHGREKQFVPKEVVPTILQAPLVWVSTDALGERAYQRKPPGQRSLENGVEADAVVNILRELDSADGFRSWLRSQDKFDHPIGIICTYAAQRELIRRRLPATGLSSDLREACKIDTVDSYQGKENPIVILSLVRNNAEGPIDQGKRCIKPGFLARPNRMNVAMSRAMDHLIIVGAKQRWQNDTPLARVVKAFEQEEGRSCAATVPADEVARSDRRKKVSKKR